MWLILIKADLWQKFTSSKKKTFLSQTNTFIPIKGKRKKSLESNATKQPRWFHFQDQVIKRRCLLSWTPSLFSLPLPLIIRCGENQQQCYKAALWRGSHGEGWSRANNCVSEPRRRFLPPTPCEPSDETTALTNSFAAASQGTWSQRHPLKPCLHSWPTETVR